MKNIRFGIIGVGNIAPIHATAIQKTEAAEIAAVATRNEERGRAFAAEHGGKFYKDYHDLLADSEVDAISICTSHDLHQPIAVEAAVAGKHVLCEKPMARNAVECDAMISACDHAGVTLGVIFPYRFEPLAGRLKPILEAGLLGKLLWVSANTIWYRSDEYYRSGEWRRSLELGGGGVLINQAIHAIDLMIWLTGMPRRVSAKMRTLNHEIQVEDGALAMLEYDDKRLGLIQAATAAYPGYPERLEFYGTRGSAIYHKGEGRLEWHLVNPREDRVEESSVSSGAARPMDISAAGHIAQYQDFIAALRDHRPPLVDGHEGRKSVELIEAIYRSAGRGTPIDLPLQ